MVNDFTRIWGRTEKEGYPMIKNKKILIPLLVVIIILFGMEFRSAFAAGDIELPCDSTLTQTINRGGEEHWYLIKVPEDGNYKIKTFQAENKYVDTVIYLYDHTKEKQLAYSDNLNTKTGIRELRYSEINVDLSKKTSYYLKVKLKLAGQTGPYNISLKNNNTYNYETVNKTFASFHASYDTSPSDAKAFAESMKANGWTATASCDDGIWCDTGTLAHIKDSSPNILYFSGHGDEYGKMSYYDGHGDRATAPWVHYNETQPMPTLVGNSWNGNLDWVVLASCNQLSTAQTREKWASTMKGNKRPVKGILSYGLGPNGEVQVAPDGEDTGIAKAFVNLCFNSTNKRVIYAWLQANASYGFHNAGALYHSVNEQDTLTKVTKHRENISYNFKYMQMTNSYTYNKDENPFAKGSNSVEASPLAKVDFSSTANLKRYENDLLSEILVEEDLLKGTILRNEKLDIDLKDEQGTLKKIEGSLRAKKLLPEDAKLLNICTITREDLDGKNKEVLGYMYNYGHAIQGLQISTDGNGDYIKVFVGKDGIEEVNAQWSKIKVEGKKSSQQIQVNEAKGKEHIRKKLKESDKNAHIVDKVSISNGRLVYVRSSKDSSKYVPAWEYEVGGTLMHVECVSGEVK